MLKKPMVRLVALLLIVIAGLVLGKDRERFAPKGDIATTHRHEQRDRQTGRASTSAIQGPIWTSTRTLSARENAEAHWQKHHREFPEYGSAQEYIEGAHRFLRGPPADTEEKTRPNGDRLLYHAGSNTFAVQARSGAPRTMFRPRNGPRYWSRQ